MFKSESVGRLLSKKGLENSLRGIPFLRYHDNRRLARGQSPFWDEIQGEKRKGETSKMREKMGGEMCEREDKIWRNKSVA